MALYNRENTLRMLNFYKAKLLQVGSDRLTIIRRINELQADLSEYQ